MIQRIQSLYLFLGAVLTGLMLALPLGDFLGGTEEAVFTAFGFRDVPGGELILNTYGLAAVIIAASLLPLVMIFLYKKRMVQYRLCVAELVLLGGIFIFEVYYFWGGIRGIAALPEPMWTVKAAAFFPIAAFVFTLLALRAIKKDILLVKSLDRIR